MAQEKFKIKNLKFKINDKILSCVLASILFFVFTGTSVYAESSYVLPYPSSMPGGILYKPHLVWEKIMKYWHFGNFGQFEYNLKQSDRYLVEAKTLFEYKQFLLGYSALIKSDSYFSQSPLYLELAKKENKNIEDKKNILRGAALKHMEILYRLKNEVPKTFEWTPEKSSSTALSLEDTISESIEIRKNKL